MAITVANSNNRLHDADADAGANWDSDGGAGPADQNEPDLGYQKTSGANWARSRKVGTGKGGLAYTDPTGVDMTAEANQVVMLKGCWYNNINAGSYPACGFRVGSTSANHGEYAVVDDGAQGDLDADPKRLIYIVPVDPNVTAWPDVVTGTVDPASMTFFGIQGKFGGSAKSENVAMDAVDIARGGGVLWLTGSSPDGVFDDFVAHDEGDITARYGHISTLRPNIFEVFGKLWIGRTETPTATLTVFNDSGKTLIFGKGFFDAGWSGLGIDLGNSSTDIDLSDVVLSGLGQNGKKVYFDTITEVDPTPDEVTLVPAPGFITSTPVVYSNEGGSDSIGLTSGNEYWLEFVTSTTFNVHSLRNNARTAATPIALSDGSTGEAHSFTRTPDIRPDLEVVGQSGAFDATRTTFNSFRSITLTSGTVFTSCVFSGCELLDNATETGGTVQSSTLSGQTTEPGKPLLRTNITDNIDNNNFVLSAGLTGHAIEITQTGSTALVGNTLTGYWVSPDNDNGATFHTITGVDASTEVVTTDGNHGFSTGDEVWYHNNGLTDTIGLTSGNRYYVNVAGATTFTLHRSKATAVAGTPDIDLSDGSTGETHTFYSGNAAVLNATGGAVTINITNGTGTSVRNVGTSTTTVLAAVTLTVTVLDVAGVGIEGVQVAIYRQSDVDAETELGNELMNELTDSFGEATEAFNYSTDLFVEVRARSSSGAIPYVPRETSGKIEGTGLSVTITLDEDGALNTSV